MGQIRRGGASAIRHFALKTDFPDTTPLRTCAGSEKVARKPYEEELIVSALAAIALAAQPTSGAPQAPIAAGPFASIVEVLGAAKECGVQQLRIEMYPTEYAGDTRLYLLQSPQALEIKCLNSWLTVNGKRLRLAPRWWNDDFSRDAPN